MVNGTSTKLSNFVTNILFPGSNFLLSPIRMANGVIHASSSLLETIINAFKVGDDLLSMNPTTLNIQITRAAQRL